MSENFKSCSRCSAKLPVGCKFCARCGLNLSEQPSGKEPKTVVVEIKIADLEPTIEVIEKLGGTIKKLLEVFDQDWAEEAVSGDWAERVNKVLKEAKEVIK